MSESRSHAGGRELASSDELDVDHLNRDGEERARRGGEKRPIIIGVVFVVLV